jgi:tetratricopeptide (TPR) repeat protein
MVKGRIPTRRIKHDEFASTVSRWILFIEDHARQAIIAGVALVIVLVLILGIGAWFRTRSREASFALGTALAEYRQAAGGGPPVPGQPVAAAQYQTALESFQQVAADHPRSRVGPIASFYSALCLIALERNDQASTALEEFLERYPDAFHAPQAGLALARLAERQGDNARALELLRAAAEQDSLGLPQPEALMELARFLELTGSKDEALRVYERLQTEFPLSEFLGQAQQRSLVLAGTIPAQ